MPGIFFNREALVFSLPLVTLCGGYAYFKYVPLQYGGPLLASIIGFLYLRSVIRARQVEKSVSEPVDENLVRKLTGEDKIGTSGSKAAEKKKKKAEEKLKQRLKEERRKEEVAKSMKKNSANVNGSGDAAKVADDDDDLLTFAKGGRSTAKKQR
mmetsp:Transcript_36925/g.42961  ORF Transcript_36925/g.42961 Transcript_36925/m.42961 type:complete len:154 (+) Transcript_36925:76-537(+)